MFQIPDRENDTTQSIHLMQKNNDKLHQVPKQKPGKNCNVPATKTSG